MKNIIMILSLMLVGFFSQAQSPTKQQTFEFLRTKMIANSIHPLSEVLFDPNTCIITIKYAERPTGYDYPGHPTITTTRILYISNLDANGVSWELDNSGLGITISAKQNTLGQHAESGEGFAILNDPFAVFFFSPSKIPSDPDFQNSMTKAFVHLIELCGGTKKTKLF